MFPTAAFRYTAQKELHWTVHTQLRADPISKQMKVATC